MKEEDANISRRWCQKKCREAHSNFTFVFFILPRKKRAAMEAVYAFMRHADDLADDPSSVSVLREEMLASKRAALDLFGIAVQAAIDSQMLLPVPQENSLLAEERSWLKEGMRIVPALAAAASDFPLVAEDFLAVLRGVSSDLTPSQPQSVAELEQYCELVASAVGRTCLAIWGLQPASQGNTSWSDAARRLGIAFQWTNILRDLAEDFRNKRIYLPREDCERFHYSFPSSPPLRETSQLRELLEHEIERANHYYQAFNELLPFLHPDGQRMAGMMTDTYYSLLRSIAKNPFRVLRERVHLSPARKLTILAGRLLHPRKPLAWNN